MNGDKRNDAHGGSVDTTGADAHRAREKTRHLHATAIAVGASGVLIVGASGRGKSNLALRALARAPNTFLADAITLIADDQVEIENIGGTLSASAPKTIAGQLEVRGIGIVSVPYKPGATDVRMVVRLTDAASIERLPMAPRIENVLGQPVPAVDIDPADPAAVEKILIALREINAHLDGERVKT